MITWSLCALASALCACTCARDSVACCCCCCSCCCCSSCACACCSACACCCCACTGSSPSPSSRSAPESNASPGRATAAGAGAGASGACAWKKPACARCDSGVDGGGSGRAYPWSRPLLPAGPTPGTGKWPAARLDGGTSYSSGGTAEGRESPVVGLPSSRSRRGGRAREAGAAVAAAATGGGPPLPSRRSPMPKRFFRWSDATAPAAEPSGAAATMHDGAAAGAGAPKRAASVVPWLHAREAAGSGARARASPAAGVVARRVPREAEFTTRRVAPPRDSPPRNDRTDRGCSAAIRSAGAACGPHASG